MIPLWVDAGFGSATIAEVNPMLSEHHYLGPVGGAIRAVLANRDSSGVIDQCQVWKPPTARALPNDGTWLELARWCIISGQDNAGSWFMGRARRWIKARFPRCATLISYSELGRHSGGLYRASGWQPLPTHHTTRWHSDGKGYPSGHGSWDSFNVQQPKERWVIRL